MILEYQKNKSNATKKSFNCADNDNLFSGSVCKNEINYNEKFDESYSKWLQFKDQSANSYQYRVSGESWTGSSWQTNISVINGIVSKRHFKYTSTRGMEENIPSEVVEWVEEQNEINSHKNTSAAESFTLDQVYEKARKEWLINKESSETYFKAQNDGLISLCGYVDNNCADDCFVGIKIDAILPL